MRELLSDWLKKFARVDLHSAGISGGTKARKVERGAQKAGRTKRTGREITR